MIEMHNDVMRRATFDRATQEAAKDKFDYSMHKTMEEQLRAMRVKSSRKKRKIPWFTIFTLVTMIPFFMGGGMPSIGTIRSQGGISDQQIQEAISTMRSMAPNDKAQVSIQVGNNVLKKEVTLSDVEALNNNNF